VKFVPNGSMTLSKFKICLFAVESRNPQNYTKTIILKGTLINITFTIKLYSVNYIFVKYSTDTVMRRGRTYGK
jgi:hypothetical protein